MLNDSIESVPVKRADRRKPSADGPRRKYSLDFKLKVLQEAMAPGASVAAVALRHNMNTNVVFRWRRLFREGRLTGEPGADKKLLPPPDFLPVQVVPDKLSVPTRPEAGEPARRSGRGMMEITLRCGVVVRAYADVDDEALVRVVAAVGELA